DRVTPVVPHYPATGPGWPAVAPVGGNGIVRLAVNGSAVGVRRVNAGAAPVIVGVREQRGRGIAGAPSVLTDPAGRIMVFGRGGGNIVSYQWRNAAGGPWSGWLPVPHTAAAAAPTAIVHGGQVELFYPAADGSIR